MLTRDVLQDRRYPGPLAVAGKRGFDVVLAVVSLPAVGLVALLLLLLNPLWNRGPLFFVQQRMGRNCEPFRIVKFRTMTPAPRLQPGLAGAARGPDDPVEESRITPLGRVLRRLRIDELPQFLNVLAGDMSVIGPRPDVWDHAIHYLDSVPGYRERHTIRPGITGLAQVDGGYAEGVRATMEKTRIDLEYIYGFGLRMEAYVLMRTIRVVISGAGAR